MNLFNNINVTEGITPKEQLVLNFLTKNSSQIETMSIQALAETIGVSTATISRVTKKLGYNNFNKLKLEIAKRSGDNILDAPISASDTLEDILSKFVNSATLSIQQTSGMLSIETLRKATQYLKKAPSIYLFGVGASGIVCSDFYYKLNRIGRHCIYVQDPHIQLASVAAIKPNDLALAISYEGRTKEVLEAVTFAKSVGAKTIAITGMGNNQLAKLADLVFRIPQHEHELRVAAIASRNNSLFLTDLLYLSLIQGENQELVQILEKTKSLTETLKN